MEPVYPNIFKTLPAERLTSYLHFHGGVATVRDNILLPDQSPARRLFRAVESRRSELRMCGYHTLTINDVIHVYAPEKRNEYYRDKYGTAGPLLAILVILLALVASFWGTVA